MCQGRKSGLLGNLGKIQVTFCDQALGVQDAQGIDVLDDGAVGVLLEFMAGSRPFRIYCKGKICSMGTSFRRSGCSGIFSDFRTILCR